MKIPWTDLHLSTLKYFVDAVRLNSLTKAAEYNFVSRPAISQAIRRLEGHLGEELFEHKKRSFVLTKRGHSFFLKARAAIEGLTRTLEDASPSGGLRLACSATLAEYILIPFIKKLKADMVMDVRIGTSSRVRQLVESGDSALGLLIDDGKTVGFESKLVRKGEFYFLSKSGKIKYPIITTEMRPEVALALRSLPIGSQKIQVESWGIGLKMAQAMDATCLVPDLIPSGSLKPIQVRSFKYEYRVLAISKNKNHLSQIERKFFE